MFVVHNHLIAALQRSAESGKRLKIHFYSLFGVGFNITVCFLSNLIQWQEF